MKLVSTTRVFQKIEISALYLFILLLPSSRKHLFYVNGLSINGSQSDFYSVFLFGSDILFLLLLLAYFTPNLFKPKDPGFPSQKVSKVWTTVLNFAFLFIVFIVFAKLDNLPRETITAYNLLKILELFSIGYYFYQRFQSELFRKVILSALFASGVLEAIIGIAQFIHQRSVGLHWLGEQIIGPAILGIAKIDTLQGKVIRAYGLFAHPNQLAAFLIVACATGFYLYIKTENKKSRAILAIGILIIIVGEFATFSRAGILSLAAALILILCLAYRTNRKENSQEKNSALGHLIFITIVSVIISLFAFHNLLTVRISSTDTGISRFQYDSYGLQIIKDHPISGAGIGQLIPQMAARMGGLPAWQIQPPHNYFIAVGVELGAIVAFAIFAFFVYLAIRLLKDIWRGVGDSLLKIILFATLAAILALMQVDHYFYTLQQTEILLWMFIGMISATIWAYS